MGQMYSSVKSYFFVKPEKIILIYGFTGVGKSTVFDKMQLEDKFYPTPSPHFCEGTKIKKDYIMHFCDVAGCMYSSYKGNYFVGERYDAVIFVVDSTDGNSMNEANEILKHMLLSDELKNAVFLIYANKQDLPNALDPTKVAEMINFEQITRQRHIVGCSGVTGDGVLEGLEWLDSVFTKKKWFNIL